MLKRLKMGASGFPLAALAACLVAACAGPSGAEPAGTRTAGRQCFLPQQVNGFHAPNDETVYVTVGARRIFRLQTVGTCPHSDWSQRIGIRSRGGASWICQGLDADLIVPSPIGVQRCPVTNVHQLSEEEVRQYRESRRGRRR
jgi:hypothetical protein